MLLHVVLKLHNLSEGTSSVYLTNIALFIRIINNSIVAYISNSGLSSLYKRCAILYITSISSLIVNSSFLVLLDSMKLTMNLYALLKKAVTLVINAFNIGPKMSPMVEYLLGDI